ncbi:CLUMA_CG005267, isoform A [Clunio marinus]|uniref:CLUMA_CG005267, isoform A n=1 Tax=Clunio marinus TaxID=568069 RepID=A0A1J1HUC9_9DIPT|nr:CLUMA_CG005267, isoform A [Clunio marinus]
MYPKWLIVLAIEIVLSAGQLPILDSRCYLENGGSAENFIVSEDIRVDSVIGQLKINGDPSPNGNINLSLRERDRNAPVAIDPGTKDLILTSKLDKEGELGPASVYVNVVCDRKHSDGIPSFIIPVNIRVQDVNDNNPKWIGAPYTINLSEVTVKGTRILQGARAVDADQPGPYSTVEYQVLPGPFSDYVDFVNPLEGTLQLKKSLDYEQLKNFTVKLRAQDQGNPPKFSDTFLRVFITDADDQNPKFKYDSYTSEFPPLGKIGRLRIYPESIRAWDQDDGLQAEIRYSINPSPESRYFSINPKTGDIDLITSFEVQKTTLVLKATQVDNKDRYALATLTIMRAGSSNGGVVGGGGGGKYEENIRNEQTVRNDQIAGTSSTNVNIDRTPKIQFIQPKYEARVREDVPAGARLIALPTNKPSERYLQYTILDKAQNEIFEIGQFGEVILKKALDYEKAIRHVFRVMASDGISNATCQVIIDVLNVNEWDPRFRQPYYRFRFPSRDVMNISTPMALGKIEAADGDRGENINFNLRGQYASHFVIDPNGVIWLKDPLEGFIKKELSLIATATDSGQRTTTVPVTLVMEAETSQAHFPSLFSLVAAVFIIFVFVVILISIFIFKRKSSQVHSNLPSSMQSSAGLVSQEKRLMNGHMIDSTQEQLNFLHAGSNLSPGASSIAATIDAQAQTLGALARSGYRGRFYTQPPQNDDIEKDSISNSETTTTRDMNRATDPRNKKLSWQHEEFQKNDVSGSLDLNGSTENNLIVYF